MGDNQTFFSIGSSFNQTNLSNNETANNNNTNPQITSTDLSETPEITAEDILNEFQRENQQKQTDQNATHAPNFKFQQNAKLFQELSNCLYNEKLAPDVLVFPYETIENVLGLIKQQKERIKQLQRSNDNKPLGSRNNNNNNNNSDKIFSSMIGIQQMEINRVEYMLKSLFRCRLSKIEKYAVHYNKILESISAKCQNEEEEENEPNLTEEEKYFYERFDADEGKFIETISENDINLFKNQILKNIPEDLYRIYSDNFISTHWPSPNKEAYCFAKVIKENIDDLEIYDFTNDKTDIESQPKIDQVYLLPFDKIKERLGEDLILI